MDDSIWAFLGLLAIAIVVLGPASFVLVLLQRGRLKEAEQRISLLLDRVRQLEESKASQQRPAPATEPDPMPVPDETPATAPQSLTAATPEPEPGPLNPPEPATSPVPAVAARPPRRSLEEALGTKWTVWVGGLALGLGALLLVRYSIEQGFFGPGARVLIGLILAAALTAGGEALRRRQRGTPAAGVDIAATLTACGAVAAFGAIYAAHAVYGFIDVGPAFFTLAAIAIACMFAAALHGPKIAALGLLGSLLTPILVSSDNPNPWALTIYLAVVSASAYGLARLRGWRWLSIATACGNLAWLLLMWIPLAASHDPAGIFAAGSLGLLIQTGLALYVLAFAPFRGLDRNIVRFDPIACLLPTVFAVFAEYWLSEAGMHGQFNALWVIVAILMPVALAGAGLLSRPVLPLFAAAGAFVFLTVDSWPGPVVGIVHPIYWQVLGFVVGAAPLALSVFTAYAASMSVGIGALGTRRMLRDSQMSSLEGAIICAVAALTPLGALILSWIRIGLSSSDFLFAAIAALLGVVFVFAATLFRQALSTSGEADRDRLTFGLGSAASASFGALALALVFALSGGTLTVAIALAALGCAYVSARLDIAALRWCAAGCALAIAARLAWDPRIVGSDLGKTLVVNWLLFGYGVPALAMGLVARIMRRAAGEDRPVQIAQAACILFSGFLVLFEIRHALYDGDILAVHSSMVEQGIDTFAAFGFAFVLTRLDAGRASIIFRIASYGFGLLSLAGAAFGLGILHNPYVFGDRVTGGNFFNTLLLGYALPAAMAYGLARQSQGCRHPAYVMALRFVTILLTFVYLTLETRKIFHPEGDLSFWHGTSDAEFYCYSAVWLAFALVLLAYGVWRGSREARLGSAVFLVLTVLKVFLMDLDGLEGLLRALSFIGLGVVLIGVGLVYQKLVFRPQRPDMV